MLLSNATHNRNTKHQPRTQPRFTQNLDFNPTLFTFAAEELSQQSGHSLYTAAPQQQQSSLTSRSQIPRHIGSVSSSSASATFSPPTLEDDCLVGLSQLPDLMPSDTWSMASHYTPKTFGRMSHQRESSLSSLGSTGPASPFNHTVSNPHIAVSDTVNDGFGDMPGHDGGNSYYQLTKTVGGNGGMFSGYQNLSHLEHQEMGYPTTIAVQRPRTERANLLPAPDFGTSYSRSHPASVASSTVGGDSPATPTLGEPVDDDKRRNRTSKLQIEWSLTGSTCSPQHSTALAEPPKLDRTMTDIYSDELYNPSFTITSASPSQQQQQLEASPGNELFAQRLNAANNQHLSASQSPTSSASRDRSPFRHGSPHAPMSHDFAALGPSKFRFHSAHQIREHDKAAQDAIMMKQQMVKTEADTPKTISPKDAMLDFQGADAESVFPSLFPSQETASDFGSDGHVAKPSGNIDQLALFPQTQNQAHGGYTYSAQPQGHSNINIPQQYPFVAHPQRTPPTLSSAGSSGSSTSTPVQMAKPGGSAADGGTYTCTYHGCTLRFETPSLLQKHKREGHRQPHGLGSTNVRHSEVASPLSATFINTQAGPHRCDRINPSTGKPCSTIFSRPYDLTRHEDTIHNARKQKVRCNLCTEEKTFSRADALTRHYRVCHPDVELPGKYRRRGNHG